MNRPSVQRTFFEKAGNFLFLQEMDNPLYEQSTEVLALDTKDTATPTIAGMIFTHHNRRSPAPVIHGYRVKKQLTRIGCPLAYMKFDHKWISNRDLTLDEETGMF